MCQSQITLLKLFKLHQGSPTVCYREGHSSILPIKALVGCKACRKNLSLTLVAEPEPQPWMMVECVFANQIAADSICAVTFPRLSITFFHSRLRIYLLTEIQSMMGYLDLRVDKYISCACICFILVTSAHSFYCLRSAEKHFTELIHISECNVAGSPAKPLLWESWFNLSQSIGYLGQ